MSLKRWGTGATIKECRAAATAGRELVRRGLTAEGFAFASVAKDDDFGVVDTDGADASTSDSLPEKR